jgi:acetylornithine/succinyldiaminopimelate/putrescine aminotransferase
MSEINLINNTSKSHAESVLANFYKNNFIVPEKKTYLTKLDKNFGPYLAIETEGEETQYLLDAASQIATLGLGFSAAPLMGTAHHQSAWLNDSTTQDFKQLSHSFDQFLQRKLEWCHLESTYCNSGAEANEVALGYAYKRRAHKGAKKVLAFEGSFHGRMMVSLSSTWNPSKREPFQWPGFETVFTDYPEINDHMITQEIPKDWRTFWDQSAMEQDIPKAWQSDKIMSEEIKCLLAVKKLLLNKDIFSIVIEPMQCEGGDRYSSNRFHTALLLLARSLNIAVIYDEVQTGFHLGTDFFWHKLFNLKDQSGMELSPDYLVCAKKAQVGMVLSPKPINKTGIEKESSFCVASVVRGFLHGLALDQSREKIKHLEVYALEKLSVLINKYPKQLSRPRALGMAFAFDVIDQSKISEYIAKRFDYGLLYYPAGSTTLRFRLNTSFTDNDIDYLFESIDAITDDIFNGKTNAPSGTINVNNSSVNSTELWQQSILSLRCDQESFNESEILSMLGKTAGENIEAFTITNDNFSEYKDAIITLEKETYEEARQTSISHFEDCVRSKNNVCIGLKSSDKLIGITFSSSIKDHELERGVRLDSCLTDEKTLYVIDTTVANSMRGKGLGTQLKSALTSLALIKGYNFIKGRNRDQLAAQMLRVNLSLGGVQENYLPEDYPDNEDHRGVIYYGIPLKWNKSKNLSNRLNSRLGQDNLTVDFLTSERPHIVNKVCLSNFVNERFLSHVNEVAENLPETLRHCYTASGQSECVDKIAKSILFHQKERLDNKTKMITFKNHYFGNGSFLSRSLSDENDTFFPVTHLDCPKEDNYTTVLKQLETMVSCKEAFAVWLEPVLQKTFEHTPKDFIQKAITLCRENDIPIIFNDTASSEYNYDEDHYFAASSFDEAPDAGFSFLGGQAGFVYLNEKLFIEKPLMMISTWDGDEYSYSSYVTGMNTLKTNKVEMKSIQDKFHTVMDNKLKQINGVDYFLKNGRGYAKGNLPYGLRNLLSKKFGHYIIDPAPEAMKNFLLEN